MHIKNHFKNTYNKNINGKIHLVEINHQMTKDRSTKVNSVKMIATKPQVRYALVMPPFTQNVLQSTCNTRSKTNNP